MSAYAAVLVAHSWLRWAVLLACAALLVRTYVGWRRSRPWQKNDERLQVALTAAVDLQLLLGLGLYFVLSPLIRAFLADPGPAMRDPALRFFAVEHVFLMVLVVVVVHAGRVLTKKAASPGLRHKRAFLTSLVLLALVLAGSPWPGLRHGRPLFRAAHEAWQATDLACGGGTAGLWKPMVADTRARARMAGPA